MSLAHLINPNDIKRETNYDIILKHVLERRVKDLPDVLRNQYNRWVAINQLLKDGKLVKKGKHKFQQPYRYNELVSFIAETYDVSERTAKEDIKHTKFFYGKKNSKEENEYELGVLLEWGERMMHECYGIGDYKNAAVFFKEILAVKKEMASADAPDYADIQIPHLVVVADPKDLGFESISDADIARVVERVNKNRRRSVLDKMIDQADEAQIIDELKIIPNNGTNEDLAE